MSLSTRTERWSVELVLRYVCATLVTWIAAAGTQLVVRSDFIVLIAIISFVGAPVSLYLRMHSMRIGGISLSRPLWNAFTVLLFFVCAGAWTLVSMSDLLRLIMNGGASQNFWLRFGAEGSLALLMQVFLLFAAFRSFALISDKDATLATVPSFSVLLLLIPVHKGIEVVLYFLLWTLSATTLFALDHRAELYERADGRIPAQLPGQDVRLAARGLATVLGAALIAAFSLSALLTSRNADDRSATESAITGLAGRLAQLAMSSPDSSLASGPERQIDFSSGPALPSRALLWKVGVRTVSSDHQRVKPAYFRLFTLSHYTGSSWTQASRQQKRVAISTLANDDWPFSLRGRFGGIGSGDGNQDNLQVRRGIGDNGPVDGNRNGNGFADGENSGGGFSRNQGDDNPEGFRFDRGFGGDGRVSDGRMSDLRPSDPSSLPSFRSQPLPQDRPPILSDGFSLKKVWPDTNTFGQPTAMLRMGVVSSTTNLGFVPLLPNTRSLSLLRGHTEELRAGTDGAVDLGFVPQDLAMASLNDVPMIPEYGFMSGSIPTKKVAAHVGTPHLSSSESAVYLELPTLSSRTRRFAQEALAKASNSENSYGRARRLALAIQSNATYTLRPPTPPEGREATDFFLFDGNRRGYCTHFASALTVLCRAQGIPARVVSGFAAQEYSTDGSALIREANAHAWTEVWIDNWGWAPIDATPASDRGDNAPNVFSYWGDWFGFAFNQVEMWSRSRLWLLGFSFGIVVVGVYALRRRERVSAWWARRHGKLSSDEWTRREIIVAYNLASVRLARLFRPRAPFETPDEWFAAAKESALDAPRAQLFARHEFELLTAHYLRALYAPKAPENSMVTAARELAREVRRKKR